MFIPTDIVLEKIERRAKDCVCILCKKKVRRGIVLRLYDRHKYVGAKVYFHNSCFLLLVKKLFPKDVKISKRMKRRAIANLI